MTYYTYIWLREGDYTPYYVGKGKGRRAFDNNSHYVKRPTDYSRIILLYANTEQEAFDKEKELITQFGRKDIGTGCLRNFTCGGDGAPAPSAETRKRMGLANIGSAHHAMPHTPEAKARMSASRKGIGIGRTHSEETRKKLSNAAQARSEETRQRMSGREVSEETRSRISIAKTGKKRAAFSDEAKRNMSNAVRLWWANRRTNALSI